MSTLFRIQFFAFVYYYATSIVTVLFVQHFQRGCLQRVACLYRCLRLSCCINIIIITNDIYIYILLLLYRVIRKDCGYFPIYLLHVCIPVFILLGNLKSLCTVYSFYHHRHFTSHHELCYYLLSSWLIVFALLPIQIHVIQHYLGYFKTPGCQATSQTIKDNWQKHRTTRYEIIIAMSAFNQTMTGIEYQITKRALFSSVPCTIEKRRTTNKFYVFVIHVLQME